MFIVRLFLTLLACAPAQREAYEAAAGAPDEAALETALAGLTDPIVRDAALLTWVGAHREGLSRVGAERLCARVSTPEDRSACLRRHEAAHLAR